MKSLSDTRKKFSCLAKYCHLISNSLGAMPDAARAAQTQYLDLWSGRGVRAWEEEWWLRARRIGDKIASLLGAPPDSVSMHVNVTGAQAVILSCFDWVPPRDKTVMVELEFPSLLYLYREWNRDHGRLVTVPSDDGVTIDTQRLLDAIDDNTQLVSISHVLFKSAFVVDVPAVVARAHQVGARVVVDCFQSLGTVPVDVSAWNVDFAVGGCLKWLCGGPGAAYLYVRPDLDRTLEPRFTGWFAHKDPFGFDPGPITRTTGSYRFQTGTPAVPALFACEPGLDIVTELGVENIRTRSLEMTAKLLELARERGFPVHTPEHPVHRGGTLSVMPPHAEEVSHELCRRDFLVDYRPGAGIRLSPHFYNTDDELMAVFGEMDSILAGRPLAP